MYYLSDYQTFNDVHELNHHVKQHEQAHYNELNATDRAILRFIARYSVKYSGASRLLVATIAEGVGKSERTIARVLKRLESLRIIRRIGTIRPKSGGKGASIIQILPFDSDKLTDRLADCEEGEKSTPATGERLLFDKEPLHKQSNYNTRTRDGAGSFTRDGASSFARNGEGEEVASKRGLRTAIPTPIYEALAPYYDVNELYDTIGILFRSKASIDRTITLEQYADDYIDVFYNVIRKYKLGQVRNLSGLLYSAWQRVTAEISRRVGAEGNPLYYNWLA